MMNSLPWFRFYSNVLNDPKVQSLDGDTFKFWVNLLCVTSQCDGVLPSHDEIAFYLRLSHEEVNVYLKTLVAKGLVDLGEKIKPHNWDKRQYKSDTSKERTKKYRERKKQKCDVSCDVTASVTVTPPDTDTDTDIKKENKKEKSFLSTRGVDDVIPDLIKKRAAREKNAELVKQAKEVIEFLNRKTNKNFEFVDSNLNFVMCRLKEGASVEDCRMIIAAKCREWNTDENFKKFLRPATLFNKTKFWQYKGELKNEE